MKINTKSTFNKIRLTLDRLGIDPIISPNVKEIDRNLLLEDREYTPSVRIKNWSEPFQFGGKTFTLFYTEVDHKIKVGDKVFIEGGVYDSNTLIDTLTTTGFDGRTVIYVDRCKIALDIEWIGELPIREENIDNFVKVYVANTQDEFNYYSQLISMRGGSSQNKFDIGINNFLYLNGTFSITPGQYNLSGFGSDLGLSTIVQDLGNKFVIRAFTASNNYFIDINNDVIGNNFEQYLNPNWNQSQSPLFNNKKLRIFGGNFINSGINFRRGSVYTIESGQWKLDITYSQPIITKSHFRGGFFKGKFRSGLFGSHNNDIKWRGDLGSEWEIGTTLNTEWKGGKLDSKEFSDNSYFTVFDDSGFPQIRTNSLNNGGWGYNYIINTHFESGDIINGNFYNISTLNSPTQSSLKNWASVTQSNFPISLLGGIYYESNLHSTNMRDTTLVSTIVENSSTYNSKFVNSQVLSTLIEGSSWISDRVIEIEGYRESDISWYGINSPINYRMYRFYLTPENWERLKTFDNFYFGGLVINQPGDDILNQFDDKFTIGDYIQSYEDGSDKLQRGILVQLSTSGENNDPIKLPSLDLFIEGGSNLNGLVDISNAYIIDSDFTSGVFKDSNWISGNHFGYNLDYAITQYNSGYTASIDQTSQSLEFEISPKLRKDILGDVTFLNSLYFDSSQIGLNNNLVKLNDTWIVDNIDWNSNIVKLVDSSTQSNISGSAPQSTIQLTTPGAKNRWNYLFNTKFINSSIRSGIFRRGYFTGCEFTNDSLNLRDNIELGDKISPRELLVSDVIFGGGGNIINNGLFQYSHVTSGGDIWRGGMMYKGVWDSSLFTYSVSPTSSVVYKSKNTDFLGGIFKMSTWIFGRFLGGIFYKNESGSPGNQSIFLDDIERYHTDGPQRLSWQGGEFINGEFERSNFETGIFQSGNFFKSNFLGGVSNGGNFGKLGLESGLTRVWSGTFSRVNVINANFISQSPAGFGQSSIFWDGGTFSSGQFGVFIDNYSNSQQYLYQAIWNGGEFNGGEFRDIAKWKGGKFNGGLFTSYYGWISGNPLTPYQIGILNKEDFSWEGGEFNGGQFGNGSGDENSTWWDGEFNGGKFVGRYWKSGIFSNGEFFGGSTFPTDRENYNRFLRSFHTRYYGYWNDGVVSRNKDRVIKDKKLWTKPQRATESQRRLGVNFKNMIWRTGTFSHYDGEMNNSIWLNGSFEDGRFIESTFNPYINLLDGLIIYPITQSQVNIVGILEPGLTYSILFEIDNPNTQISGLVNQSGGVFGFTQSTFVATGQDLILDITGSVINMELYPGTVSGFRTGDDVIWRGGYAYSSDIHFTTWEGGIFDSTFDSNQGNAWGITWEGGISKYMNAYNILWKGGVWKNGNWWGSPFNRTSKRAGVVFQSFPPPSQFVALTPQPIVPFGFDLQIINRLSIEGLTNSIHINHSFTQSSPIPGLDSNLELEYTDSLRNWDVDLYINNSDFTNNDWTWTNSNPQISLVDIPFLGLTFSRRIGNLPGQNGTVVWTQKTGKKLWIYDGNRDILSSTSNYKIVISYFLVHNSLGGDLGSFEGRFVESNVPPFDKSSPTSGGNGNYSIRFNIGNTQSVITGQFPVTEYPSVGGFFGTTGIKTFEISYNQLSLSNQEISIEAISLGPSNPLDLRPRSRLYVTKFQIEEVEVSYSDINNTKIQITQPTDINNQISLPNTNNISYSSLGINTRIGNGRFVSGIWENGVWNEGWRDDDLKLNCLDIIRFPNTTSNKAINLGNRNWSIELSVSDDDINRLGEYSIGNRVSVGNIVSIDLNGRRKLIKDIWEVKSKSQTTITIETTIDYPIRTVERDSNQHLIYVTKNIWLNGIFLNGTYDGGVWNNGLVKGYPYVTKMMDSHIIDGNFIGGHFKGTTQSYVDIEGNVINYNTSLVQRFDFSDENVSNKPLEFKYNSWIDVVWNQLEGVAINKPNSVFKPTILGVTLSHVEMDYYGYSTGDILESKSKLRNPINLSIREYNLGYKFNEYGDFLSRVGQFNGINQLIYTNSNPPFIFSNLFGVSDLLQGGWTFSFYGGGFGFATAVGSIGSNIGSLDSQWLYISGGNNNALTPPLDGSQNFTLDIFDNENIEILNNRYSYIELDIENLNTSNLTNPWVFYNHFPPTYSVSDTEISFNGATVSLPINQLETQSSNRREYFFNKPSLDLSIFAGPTYSIRIKSIKFVEVDQIPFPKIFTESYINKDVQVPNSGKAFDISSDIFIKPLQSGDITLLKLPISKNNDII
jgi:hypothetical protein